VTSTLLKFENSFAHELTELGVDWQASSVPAPELLAFNVELATELGADPEALQTVDGIAALVGNTTPEGAEPIAMAYAGHQFGGYSPRLGDGRALLLGEVIDSHDERRDLHLKGSGRTPFARGGDGKAELGPMLREYLIAEAMYALGIPTTRALAVLSTGERIVREGSVPGAILARVASSHIRVGTFEYAARSGDEDLLRRLADYSIARHYPAAAEADNPYLALLDAVVTAQADLVASWMLVGFIHGVMNTDNVTVSGETIDYGPCAFMDRYDEKTVFSSIDRMGRYAYGNQPSITQWNLARFAETLMPLIDSDGDAAVAAATEVLEAFSVRYNARWAQGMRTKLGLTTVSPEDDGLFADLVVTLPGVDYTSSFRALASTLRGDNAPLRSAFSFDQPALDPWIARWHARVDAEGEGRRAVADRMDRVNPLYIPRNHLVDEALEAATGGNLEPFNELLEVVTQPYDKRPHADRFAQQAPDAFTQTFQTYCGT
jgi:uncharacterized protein YdiU (UPF0061 family)